MQAAEIYSHENSLVIISHGRVNLRIPIYLIQSLYIGKDNDIDPRRYPKDVSEGQCFSILYGQNHSTSLIATDIRTAQFWVTYLYRYSPRITYDVIVRSELKHLFDHHAENRDSITPDVCLRLLKYLYIPLEMSELRTMIRKADANSDGMVTFEEFVSIIETLSLREEVVDLFRQHAPSGIMDAPTFKKFLQTEQGEVRASFLEDSLNILIKLLSWTQLSAGPPILSLTSKESRRSSSHPPAFTAISSARTSTAPPTPATRACATTWNIHSAHTSSTPHTTRTWRRIS